MLTSSALQGYIDAAKKSGDEILCGGTGDDSVGFFVQPTIVQCKDPRSTTMVNEIFGPVLSLHVYDDSQPDFWREICKEVDSATEYGLTGAIFARDRQALIDASNWLRYAAGNCYLNTKVILLPFMLIPCSCSPALLPPPIQCTGAVVGQVIALCRGPHLYSQPLTSHVPHPISASIWRGSPIRLLRKGRVGNVDDKAALRTPSLMRIRPGTGPLPSSTALWPCVRSRRTSERCPRSSIRPTSSSAPQSASLTFESKALSDLLCCGAWLAMAPA